MSISDLLVSNHFNTYTNSETLNSNATQPIPGNNTLWVNSSNANKLYLGPNLVGGGSGGTSLASLTDVSLSPLVNGETLTFNTGFGKWTNEPPLANIPIAHNRFVDIAGSDIIGNGSSVQPYRTIFHALSTIVTASASNLFVINIGPGVWTESFTCKPYVSFNGSTFANVYLQGAIDFNNPDFNNANPNTVIFQNVDIYALSGSNTFDLTTQTASGTDIFFYNCLLITPLNVIGVSGATNSVQFYYCTGSGTINLTDISSVSSFCVSGNGYNITANTNTTAIIRNPYFTTTSTWTQVAGTLGVTIIGGYIGALTTVGTVSVTASQGTLPKPANILFSAGTTISYVTGYPGFFDGPNDNLFIGDTSPKLTGAVLGNGNTYVNNSPLNLASANDNTCVGLDAGTSVVGGFSNTCVGVSAGSSLTNGSTNTYIGLSAGANDTIGTDNTCIGVQAGFNISGGVSNTCLGAGAGSGITTGSGNVIIGQGSCTTLTTGGSNTAIGYATFCAAAGSSNVIVGQGSNVGGAFANNTIVGFGSSSNNNNCVVLGCIASPTLDNQLVLGSSSVNLNNATTVGAAGGASALPATPLGYLQVYLNGALVSIPYYNP
jgi:hypothetical protein